MAWTVEFNAYAERKLRRLDPQARGRILKYLQDNLEGIDDARILGRALRGNPPNRWRYRAGDYRIICRLDDNDENIVVLDVGHRRNVYR